MYDEMEDELSAILQEVQWLEAIYKGTMAELRTITQLDGAGSNRQNSNSNGVVAREVKACLQLRRQRNDCDAENPTKPAKPRRQHTRPHTSSNDNLVALEQNLQQAIRPRTTVVLSRQFHERSAEHLRSKAAKEEKLRAQLELERDVGATFQPQTTTRAKNVTRQVEDMMAWEDSRKSRQIERRQQHLQDERQSVTGVPRLNERSKQLLQQKRQSGPTRERTSSGESTAGRRAAASQSKSPARVGGLIHGKPNTSRSTSVPTWSRQRTQASSRSDASSQLSSKSPSRSRSTERQSGKPETARQYRRQSAAQIDSDILQFEEELHVYKHPKSRATARRIRLSELESENAQRNRNDGSDLRRTTTPRGAYKTSDLAQGYDDQLWRQYRTGRETPAYHTPVASWSRCKPQDTSVYTSPPYEDSIAEAHLVRTNHTVSAHRSLT